MRIVKKKTPMRFAELTIQEIVNELRLEKNQLDEDGTWELMTVADRLEVIVNEFVIINEDLGVVLFPLKEQSEEGE